MQPKSFDFSVSFGCITALVTWWRIDNVFIWGLTMRRCEIGSLCVVIANNGDEVLLFFATALVHLVLIGSRRWRRFYLGMDWNP